MMQIGFLPATYEPRGAFHCEAPSVTESDWRYTRAQHAADLENCDLSEQLGDVDFLALLKAGASDAQIGAVVRAVRDAYVDRLAERELYGRTWAKDAEDIGREALAALAGKGAAA